MLTHSQVAKALSKAAGFDNRTVTQSAVAAWQEALQRWPNMTEGELLGAVTEHYALSADFMQASHVYPAVKRIRERRDVQRSRQRALTAAPDTRPDMSYDQIVSRLKRPEFLEEVARGRAERAAHFGEPTDADGEYTDPPGWHPSQEPYKAPSIHTRAMV